MIATDDQKPAPNLRFGHLGLSVMNIETMEKFYTECLGFAVTDRGAVAGMKLVFLSRDPLDHHQIALASGRPDTLPANTQNPQFGPSINQISFKMGSLDDLRDMHERLQAAGASNFLLANHGVAWSIYAHDPEGNNLEFFVETAWYIKQPFLIPLDFTKSDTEFFDETKALCESRKEFEPYSDWRQKVAVRMPPPFSAPEALQ